MFLSRPLRFVHRTPGLPGAAEHVSARPDALDIEADLVGDLRPDSMGDELALDNLPHRLLGNAQVPCYLCLSDLGPHHGDPDIGGAHVRQLRFHGSCLSQGK